MKVDIVNLSQKLLYLDDEVVEIIKEMSEKYGIIIVLGAGNDGPVHMSIMEKYAKICDYALIIGSTLSDIIKKNVIDSSVRLFGYSSKGPLSSGARGIDFSAPGDAITIKPKWDSSPLELIFGTSFATANATGAIACLISALKINKIKFSPTLLRWALSNTAYLPENGDKLNFGDGILQINKAFEYLIKNNFPKYYQKSKKGIFIIKKEKETIIKKYEMSIKNFDDKISWNLTLKSKCKEEFVYISNVTNNCFGVKIDSTYLKYGSINYAEIHGIDSFKASLGVLFHLPITVIVPEELTPKNIISKEFILKSVEPFRIFIYFSDTFCTQCNIMIGILEEVTCKLGIQYSNDFAEKTEISFAFSSNETTKNTSFKIIPKEMYEICIYPFRSFDNSLILKDDFTVSKFNCIVSVS